MTTAQVMNIALSSFEATFTSFLKNKKPQKVTKQCELWIFLLYLLYYRRIRSRIRIQDAQKHTDPADPDPQQWLWAIASNTAKETKWQIEIRKTSEAEPVDVAVSTLFGGFYTQF